VTWLPTEDYGHLQDTVASAISKSCFNGGEEPQRVANLVWELPNAINRLTIPGFSVSAGGVFIHQRPYVKWPTMQGKRVELGDLLIVSKLIEKGKAPEQRALILQAKIADAIPFTPDVKQIDQWDLYATWPKFTYCGKAPQEKRHIVELDIYDAAKYLLLLDQGCNLSCCALRKVLHCMKQQKPCYCIQQSGCALDAKPTQPAISDYAGFVCEIVGLMLGRSGKLFVSPSPGTIGWDQVIYDLISKTAQVSCKAMGAAQGSPGTPKPRGHGILCLSGYTPTNKLLLQCSVLGKDFVSCILENSMTSDANEPPHYNDPWPDDPEGEGGISIIEIVVDAGEQTEQRETSNGLVGDV